MDISEHDNQQIRSIEMNLLDQKYKHYKLIYRPNRVAILRLLKIFGDIHRDVYTARLSNANYLSQRAFLQPFFHALSYALRWLLMTHTSSLQLPQASSHELDQEASDLLRWGFEYAKLSQDHVAWTRGYLTPTLNKEARIITFSYNSQVRHSLLLTQTLSEENYQTTVLSALSGDDLDIDFKPWIQRIVKRSSLGQFPWHINREGVSYQKILGWLGNILLSEVAYPLHNRWARVRC